VPKTALHFTSVRIPKPEFGAFKRWQAAEQEKPGGHAQSFAAWVTEKLRSDPRIMAHVKLRRKTPK